MKYFILNEFPGLTKIRLKLFDHSDIFIRSMYPLTLFLSLISSKTNVDR